MTGGCPDTVFASHAGARLLVVFIMSMSAYAGYLTTLVGSRNRGERGSGCRPPAAQLLQASVTGGAPADVSRPASIGFPGRESTQAGGGRGDGSEMSVISHGVASGSDHTDAIATEMRPQKSPERSVFRVLQRIKSKYCIHIGTG
ncbi:hypothetical protein BT67DRAFT_431716 [Trichocladium antarcticum]|uniref:Uncharacterized protein n=1 Tax=Trichocladium antarcticum TaxID=1450529 RepID=A0AAN6ZH65_9PEZI|nr:hypothetical protein BT67DRAFT_431716 [Trichocladium antarcticum]